MINVDIFQMENTPHDYLRYFANCDYLFRITLDALQTDNAAS
jgi:hypothetical protein